MSPPNALRQLQNLDKTSPQFHKHLSNFIRNKEYRNAIPSLQGEDLMWLVENLDSILLGISNHASPAFQECWREMRDICGVKGVLPKSYRLSDSPLDISLPSASSSKVRVQRVSIHPMEDPQKAKETFCQMTVVWKHLTHPNVVPLLGVTIDPFQLVLESDIDMTGYVSNRTDTDRLNLLSDVVEGLNYLHSCNVIHGGIKGSNVLVDAAGRARITGCGLAIVTQDLNSIRSDPDEYGNITRWIAPEILDNRGTYSKEADVFSFAMLTIEVFTGAIPFSDKLSRAAMLAIVGGERPPRPTHQALTEALWTMMRQCWDQEAHRRPQVLQILCGLIPAWKRSINRSLAMDKCVSMITAVFSDRGGVEAVKRLCRDDAQAFIDVIDETLDSLEPRLKKKCLNTLCKICGRQALLPSSFQIPLCYDRSEDALYSGGYADVWMGEHQGRKVAVKVLRVYSTSDLNKVTSRFCKEVVTWKSLHHPNVLSLLGVTMRGKVFAMISEWMANGNINEFVDAHRDANRFELLEDVARGLLYMHGKGMIHGDLKGANILIDQDYRARLADFGLLTTVLDSTHHTSSNSPHGAGTTRWMSPELLDPDRFGIGDGRPTENSDCYALGMVILEVLSGKVPFPYYNGVVVIRKITEGERPGRPQGAAEEAWFTNDLWGMLEQCWSPQPERRPTIETVLQYLKQGSTAWQPPPPDSDDGVESDSDDQSHSTVSQDSMDRAPVLSQSPPRSVNMGQVSSKPNGNPSASPPPPRIVEEKSKQPPVPLNTIRLMPPFLNPNYPIISTTPINQNKFRVMMTTAHLLLRLFETEKNYVDQLSGIIKKVASAWSRSNLPPPELDQMFRAVEAVYKANRSLLSRLKEFITDPSLHRELGTLLMRWVDDLEPSYTAYCYNYAAGFDAWAPVSSNLKLPTTLALFSALNPPPLSPSSQASPSAPPVWTLDGLFLLPHGRLKYYKGLYERLLKSTAPAHTDYKMLVGSIERLERLLAVVERRFNVLPNSINIDGVEPARSHNLDYPQPTDESQVPPEGILLSAGVVSFHSEMEEYWFRVHIIFQPYNSSGGFDLPLAKQHVLYRCYNDFYDFQIELLEKFPREAGREAENPSPRLIPYMPGPVEHVDDDITLTRKDELDEYLRSLCKLKETSARHILESIVVGKFLAIKDGDLEVGISPPAEGEPLFVPTRIAMLTDFPARLPRSMGSRHLPSVAVPHE